MDWQEIADFIRTNGVPIANALIVLGFGLPITGTVVKTLKYMMLKASMERTIVSFAVTLIRLALYIMLFLGIAGILKLDLSGISTIAAAFTLAISLSLQNLIGSVADGVLLINSKPFVVGDYIELGSIGGTVQKISLIHTTLNTPDNKRVILPNTTVFTSNIINYSSNDNRRLDLIFEIDYDENVERAKGIILDVLKANKMVLKQPAPMVRLKEQMSSALGILARVWVKNAEYWDLYFDLQETVYAALIENHVDIPFDQMVLSFRTDGTETLRVVSTDEGGAS